MRLYSKSYVRDKTRLLVYPRKPIEEEVNQRAKKLWQDTYMRLKKKNKYVCMGKPTFNMFLSHIRRGYFSAVFEYCAEHNIRFQEYVEKFRDTPSIYFPLKFVAPIKTVNTYVDDDGNEYIEEIDNSEQYELFKEMVKKTGQINEFKPRYEHPKGWKPDENADDMEDDDN